MGQKIVDTTEATNSIYKGIEHDHSYLSRSLIRYNKAEDRLETRCRFIDSNSCENLLTDNYQSKYQSILITKKSCQFYIIDYRFPFQIAFTGKY